MKLKTRLNKAILCICFFIVAVVAFVGIRLVETKQVSATDETKIYQVNSSDFEFVSASKLESKYRIQLRYIGSDDNVVNLLAKYAAFTPKDILIETDKGVLTLLQAQPAGVPLLNFDFSIESYNNVQPTKIVIQEGQRFIKEIGGIQLADNLILEKTGDTWEVAAAAPTVSVSITVNGVTTKEEMRTDATYTFPSVDVEENQTFVGWEINGERYAVAESVKIADCINEETQSVEIRAVCLNYALKTGAAIRCDKDMSSSGIRFTAILNAVDELPTYITGLGVIVMPQDLMDKADFTLENYSGDGQAKNFFAQRADISADMDNTFEFWATIISVLEENYNRTFAARAYLTVQTREGGVQYIWCEKIETRSVYQVATLAACDENFPAEHMKIVQTYLNKVVNITYDGNTIKLVTVATTPVIKSIDAEKKNETVVLTLETLETDFPAVTMNGIRIKDYSVQRIENELTITFMWVEE
ncbi:MAG: hypothetical protein IJA89_03925 [Clostridia bacterium]|nr:hypothetical protein [Clostridia bacterium]